MIDLRTAGSKIIVVTFSMVSVMACKKIFLKPQPVVQKDVVDFNRINSHEKMMGLSIFLDEKENHL